MSWPFQAATMRGVLARWCIQIRLQIKRIRLLRGLLAAPLELAFCWALSARQGPSDALGWGGSLNGPHIPEGLPILVDAACQKHTSGSALTGAEKAPVPRFPHEFQEVNSLLSAPWEAPH